MREILDYQDFAEELSDFQNNFLVACNSNNHQEVLESFQLFFAVFDRLIDLCPEQPTEDYERLMLGSANGLHGDITDYILRNLSQKEFNLKEIINFFINTITSSIYWNQKKVLELSEAQTPKYKLDFVKEIINSVEAIQYSLAHFSTEKRLLEICEKKDQKPISNSTTEDKRFKSKITNPQIAFCINHLFGTLINKLTKEEKVMLFEMMTGRSGVDIFNNWGGDNLTPSEKIETEIKLKSINAKIKSK